MSMILQPGTDVSGSGQMDAGGGGNGRFMRRCGCALPMQAVLTSVPPAETDLARGALPGAAIEAEPFGEGTAARHPDARVLCIMIHDEVPVGLLERLPGLQALVTRSDGYDHLPLAWLKDRGIPAFHLEGYATESVAHLATMMLIALARRVPEAAAMTAGRGPAGTGPRWDRSGLVGRHLNELTVGVLGTGRIGSAVAGTLTGLGVQVLGHDIAPRADLETLPGFRYAGSLEALLGGSDALTLHVPLDGSTRGLIDGPALARMRPGSLLVNTARGGVVDTVAVAGALESGHLAGFAADTLPGEPDPPDLPRLAAHPNVLLTPHLGAHNHATLGRRYEVTARIVHAVLAGRPTDAAACRVA